MPDLALSVDESRHAHVFEFLHDARPLLLNLGEPGSLAPAARHHDRVRLIDATHAGEWELPLIGRVDAPTAVLVRPDGYVAWVGESGSSAGLADAVSSWFGQPMRRE
jgi:3-(3-hydroxy-phenyl)propionate hydroxylase